MRRLRSSIRLKLTIATLVPLLAAIALCWVIGASIITNRFFTQAQQNVETDLNSAHELLQGDVAHLSDIIRLTGQSPETAAALQLGAPAQLAAALQLVLRNDRLSFLTVVDADGVVRYRAANAGAVGDVLSADTMIDAALTGQVASAVSRLTPAQAGRENPALPPRMVIPLVSTPRARQTTQTAEEQGMFLTAAAPVRDGAGRVVGAVYGGMLMNNDNSLVDRITRVIFRHGSGLGQEGGNATLFLGDVRIATSVLDQRGERAIGSLMSREVFEAIARGRKWGGRAFVFNDWHFSAYEPVRDYRGNVVGALYVGTPERPYLQLRSRINLIFSGVLLFVGLIGIALSAWLGSNMARPIKALEEGARRIAAGEALPDIQVESHDEIGALADEFNTMKHHLALRSEENASLNRTLEQKVVERTAQLEEKSRQLLEAQKELARSERLAGIGLLASGVAHEINNPLAIIRGNTELLQLDTAAGSGNHEELDTIMRQVGRIERIVHNLLAFARGGIKQVSAFSLGGLLDTILDQVGHQVPLEDYTINRGYWGRDVVMEGDEDQLRQVFTNLIVNGLQAMAGGGRLTVDAVAAGDTVSVTVADSGPGIAPEHRDRLFTPFFSTKRDGTGLGLAVSYGIVKDHGGEIRVASEPGHGALFMVILPCRQGEKGAADA